MDRDRLERGQVLIYLIAIGAGLALGAAAPGVGALAEPLIWPALGALLLVTFLQVRLTGLGQVLRQGRFFAAVLVGNFLLVPLLVWGLITLAGLPAPVTLGMALVLLVPCTDWYLSFTQVAGGDTAAAVAVTPLNLLLQMLLLPGYGWLLLGEPAAQLVLGRPVLTAFLILIVVPLLVAYLVERAAPTRPRAAALQRASAGLPVPLLSLVVFLVAASQVPVVSSAVSLLPVLAGWFGLFLVAAAGLGWLLARGLRLPARPARALVFSLASRNSFVVLPLALALPAGWALTPVVIIYQSLIELLGLAVLVGVARRVFPAPVT